METTFGAEYLDRVTPHGYGCGCSDPHDAWTSYQSLSGSDYEFWAFLNGK